MKVFFSLNLFILATGLFAGCSPNSSGKFQGYVEGEYVYVASPLGGALASLAVARGGEVKSGQLLFTLERESEAAALDEAKKNLAQAKASFTLSEANYARRRQLRDAN